MVKNFGTDCVCTLFVRADGALHCSQHICTDVIHKVIGVVMINKYILKKNDVSTGLKLTFYACKAKYCKTSNSQYA